jgi:hypothetical protein
VVKEKVENAKRTQFSTQASPNQKDTHYENVPIKVIQTYSRLGVDHMPHYRLCQPKSG